MGDTPEDTTSTPETSELEVQDIGGFAEVAGCSSRLKPWERQVCSHHCGSVHSISNCIEREICVPQSCYCLHKHVLL
jgi:hypothetical protein